MTTWPNWVDLIIVILVLRGCYVGFSRGLLTELVHCIGAVCVTALSVNYAGFLAHWLTPWIAWANPAIATSLLFWVLFLLALFAVHRIIRALATVIKWERVHWFLQGIGVVLGGLRGLWWAGFVLLVLVSSGVGYLKDSVEERSVVGPRLGTIARETLERVADQFPGAAHRGNTLVPPIKSER